MVEKLKRIAVEQKLKKLKLTLFTPQKFQDVFGVPKKTAITFIGRNLNSGLFTKLRNNYYQVKDSNPSLYYIGNKLYQPSYVSLATALAHYNVIPEVIYAITSVTTKATQEFETPGTIFTYSKIKQAAFTGYKAVRMEGTTVLLAEVEKALADYLYLVDLKKSSLNDRLELRSIKKSKLITYAKLFKRPSLLTLIDHVYAEYRKPTRIY